jgi:hypothetical protein
MKHYLLTLFLSLFVLLGCENIDINSPIIAPIASNDTSSLSTGGSVVINILSNDTPSTGKTLNTTSVTIIRNVTKGSTVINQDGSIQYISDGVYVGTETFTYTVKDNKGTLSNEATVTVTINATTSVESNTTS